VLWIRTGLRAGPDPGFFYLNPDTGSQTNRDPGQTLPSQKIEFYIKNIVYVGNRS
jgi:hypothetical protein